MDKISSNKLLLAQLSNHADRKLFILFIFIVILHKTYKDGTTQSDIESIYRIRKLHISNLITLIEAFKNYNFTANNQIDQHQYQNHTLRNCSNSNHT